MKSIMFVQTSDSTVTRSPGTFGSWFSFGRSSEQTPKLKLGVSPEIQHDFLSKSQNFIRTKLDSFLNPPPISYSMQTNSRDGLISLRFQGEDNIPRLKDVKRFVDYLNATLYLFDPNNSINSFSVLQRSATEFQVSYDGSNYGHDAEMMRNVASELALLSEEAR